MLSCMKNSTSLIAGLFTCSAIFHGPVRVSVIRAMRSAFASLVIGGINGDYLVT